MARSNRRGGAPQNLRLVAPLGAVVVACALTIASLGANATSGFSTEVIPTTSGPVRGVSDGKVNKFFGIRYATSPAGDNRWLPPQPPERSASVIEADTPGSACPQPQNQFSVPFQSEDCLFLNVWTPASTKPHARLPVLFWIHGGALVTGTGAGYDPSVMVENGGIIVVTINYRLGALGWLADKPLEDANGDAGNYGLMDQQLALKWVADNIARFGGDPNKVTIAGESAGGLSTLSNLASPTASGFFRAAIVESGAYMLFTVPSLATQENKGAQFAAAVGCGTSPPESDAQIAECLRNTSVNVLLQAQTIINTAPTAGVKTLPKALAQAFTSGEFNHVPVMNGTNHDEGRLFEPFFFDPTFTFVPGGPAEALIPSPQFLTYQAEVAFFSEAALGVPPTDAPALAALYPRENFPNPDNGGKPSADEALSQIFTDVVFTCNALAADQLLAKFVPVYAYEFNDPNAPNLFQPLIGFSYGSAHAAELQYLFDAATLQGPADAAANAASPAPGAKVQPPPLTAGGQTLADEMKTYWTNFVTGSTPNAATSEVAFWSPFDPVTGTMQSLVPGPAAPNPIFDFASEHNCAALAALGL